MVKATSDVSIFAEKGSTNLDTSSLLQVHYL